MGGVEYLVKLTRFSSSIKQALDYAKIVHENYVKRELLQISNNIKDDTLNPEEDKSSDSEEVSKWSIQSKRSHLHFETQNQSESLQSY